MIKLKEIRTRLGMTQQQLAEAMKTTQQTIARWESGAAEPSIANLKDLALRLGTSIDNLLDKDTPILTSIPSDYIRANEKEIFDGYWGNLGIQIRGSERKKWYPISSNTKSYTFSSFQDEGWFYAVTLNNKVLLMNKKNIERIVLVDEACDSVEDMDQAEWHEGEPYPQVIFAELENCISDFPDNDPSKSSEARKIAEEIITEHSLSDKDITKLTNEITVRYAGGKAEYFWPDGYEAFTMALFEIESSYDDDSALRTLIFSDSYGVYNLLNLDTISVIEIPKLKFDEQLRIDSDNLEKDTEKEEANSISSAKSRKGKEPSVKKRKPNIK